jgi:hypothetical protein
MVGLRFQYTPEDSTHERLTKLINVENELLKRYLRNRSDRVGITNERIYHRIVQNPFERYFLLKARKIHRCPFSATGLSIFLDGSGNARQARRKPL